MPTISKTVREAVGLEEGQQPLFWPSGEDLANPHSLHYVADKELWLSCAGDASSPIAVLYGPPDEGFTWQRAAEQFADYGCDWGRLIKTYSR